jgi:pSer/pThr/pTyr-binding forkhead associated (FHA) protein
VRRAILEVRLGSESGRKAILTPGMVLRVGRTDSADLMIPKDPQLSGVHFELSWDGARCKLRDLKSAKGTQLGGQRVEEGDVRHGSWIRAGGTDFMVHFEAVTPPPLDFESYLDDAADDEVEPLAARWLRANREPRRRAAEAKGARRQQALRALRAADGPRYAVLDAARTERIRVLLKESVESYRSLYEGIQGEALAHVAPYLVELPLGSSLLERLVLEGWEERWGIFIDYPGSFKELRRHLRRLLMIADDDTRQKYYFRSYDPGVLRAFIPTCTAKQRSEFFGEIRAFIAEGEAGELLRFEAEVR